MRLWLSRGDAPGNSCPPPWWNHTSPPPWTTSTCSCVAVVRCGFGAHPSRNGRAYHPGVVPEPKVYRVGTSRGRSAPPVAGSGTSANIGLDSPTTQARPSSAAVTPMAMFPTERSSWLDTDPGAGATIAGASPGSAR